jgi:Fungal specific transcription factor domain
VRSPTLSGSGTSTYTNDRVVDQGRGIPSPLPQPPPATPLPPVPITTTDPNLNLEHLELLHHFCTVTYRTLTPEPAQQQIWQTTVIKLGISFPFLMQQILGIAALHLAHCNPDRQSYYHTKSTELQSHALSGFQAIQNHVGASNCGAVLLFVSLLAFHVVADPLRSRGLSFNDYLDHFLGCINLMRGVRPVVITDWWTHLSESELKPLLDVQLPEQPYEIPDECRALAELTGKIEPGSTSIPAYDAAIERLHFTFAASNVQTQSNVTIRWLLAWPVQLTDKYLELLHERRPEALIILAYYGVLLHFHRASWAIGDSGASLIKAVNAHTGPYWERWMAWPNRIVESTGKAP